MLSNLLNEYLLSPHPQPSPGLWNMQTWIHLRRKCFQFALKGPALPAAEWPWCVNTSVTLGTLLLWLEALLPWRWPCFLSRGPCALPPALLWEDQWPCLPARAADWRPWAASCWPGPRGLRPRSQGLCLCLGVGRASSWSSRGKAKADRRGGGAGAGVGELGCPGRSRWPPGAPEPSVTRPREPY